MVAIAPNSNSAAAATMTRSTVVFIRVMTVPIWRYLAAISMTATV
jgi:hypothetical protein